MSLKNKAFCVDGNDFYKKFGGNTTHSCVVLMSDVLEAVKKLKDGLQKGINQWNADERIKFGQMLDEVFK